MAADVKSVSSVVITQNSDIEDAISSSLEPLIRGKTVAIKPNDTWASKEDTTGVTQPDTLGGVLRYLKAFGPRELVVTGGSGAAQTEDVFRVSGLMNVINAEGVKFFDHNRPPFKDVELEYEPPKDVQPSEDGQGQSAGA